MNTDKIFAEAIANEYAPKDTSKVVALRKLDNKAKLPSEIFTYTFGIVSSLIMGAGMCLSMKVIGSGTTGSMVIAIVIGIIGLVLMGINYPIYKKMREKGKQKYAFEIMQLAKEKKYLLSFYMNGILAVIKAWIFGNCEDDIDFMVKIISERIYPKER
ncbi:MAG: TetR family transcriptional regulator C-terminal domain-containing protein [Lachnospiraceae bacterium]|nr:TetR family transcriptional regulator C-terminal domain-containing protein [Lachnospiraceae bacterium]